MRGSLPSEGREPPDGDRRILDAHLRELEAGGHTAAPALARLLAEVDRLNAKLGAWFDSWERLRSSRPRGSPATPQPTPTEKRKRS